MSGSISGKDNGTMKDTGKENTGSTDAINIEEIMSEIRREIRENGFTDEIPAFGGMREGEHLNCRYSEAEYFDLLYEISEDSLIAWHRDLGGSAPVIFVKKAIRKLMSFVGLPIMNDQNCFNAAVTKEFAQMAGYIRMQDEAADRCGQEMAWLKEQNDRLKEQNNQLNERIGRIEGQVSQLTAQINLRGDQVGQSRTNSDSEEIL